MIRVELLGIDTVIRDEEMVKKLIPYIGDVRSAIIPPIESRTDRAISCASFAKPPPLEELFPGLLEAVLIETRKLNLKGLRAAEMIIWGGNKVRANPGPNFLDPRNPDEFTEFLA